MEHDFFLKEDSKLDVVMVELCCAGVSHQQIEIWSLVLLAASIPHTIFNDSVGRSIMVDEDDYVLARFELDSYEAENVAWPPVAPAPPHNYHSLTPVFLGLALLIFFRYTGSWSDNDFFAKGALLGRKILVEHEWWRLVTGLTLHADINHVLGNVMVGGIIVGLLGMEIGFGASLFFTIIAGVFGNLVNVWFHGLGYRGIGFSTAVFGAIGILCGVRIFNRGPIKAFLLPIGAGGGLLAMLGTGGERTDLGAHIWGMVIGGGIGILLARNLSKLEKYLQRSSCQRFFFMLSLSFVILAWYVAFGSS